MIGTVSLDTELNPIATSLLVIRDSKADKTTQHALPNNSMIPLDQAMWAQGGEGTYKIPMQNVCERISVNHPHVPLP